jgi:hypothetical protein
MATIPVFEKRDQQIGIIASAIFLTLLFIILVMFTYQVADPAPRPFVQPAATSLENLEIENLKVEVGGSSAGSPSDAPVEQPQIQTEKVLTKKENPKTKSPTGESSNSNSPNSKAEASSQQQSTNPFGTGGSATSGQGTSKFGSDNNGAAGTGPGGVGDGKGRIRLNDPVVDDIISDANHRINLRLTVNSEGNVVAIKNIASETTTNDQRIINQVIAAVKNQVKYNKKNDAGLEIVFLTVNLNAT